LGLGEADDITESGVPWVKFTLSAPPGTVSLASQRGGHERNHFQSAGIIDVPDRAFS
jgi:hypothetical protein